MQSENELRHKIETYKDQKSGRQAMGRNETPHGATKDMQPKGLGAQFNETNTNNTNKMPYQQTPVTPVNHQNAPQQYQPAPINHQHAPQQYQPAPVNQMNGPSPGVRQYA